ncbi:hypothetical protein [Streptomyces sp. NPDC018031]|uniref:hypothetical protein n=1 Tax=Streptomyces sp. NPDC018031 TaxID=3365033 RepID=UPI0037AD06F2
MTENPLRRRLRTLAIVSCLPYLALKVAWIAGSRAGIPEGSRLRDAGTALALVNAATIAMDGAVIVLALLLTRPWGLRVPAWLLVVPLWCASGLLAPIMAGFPLQLVGRAFGGGGSGHRADDEPFLDEWVFGVVYGGFIVQGLALGALAVLYTRDRWGHLLGGRLGDLRPGPGDPAQRVAAVGAALFALLPLAAHLVWACGGTAGLGRDRADDRDGDFFVLEAVYAAFSLAAASGVLMLAFRLGRGLPLRLPLALAWTGSGALACWGGWMTLASLLGGRGDADAPTRVMSLTYAVQMIVGVLVLTIGAYFFAERSAAPGAGGGRGGRALLVPVRTGRHPG